MRSKGLKINLITYNNALSALAKAAKNNSKRHDRSRFDEPGTFDNDTLWIRTAEVIDQMKAEGVTMDGFSFSSAISCFGAQGRWEDALALLNQMTKGGPRTQPNKLVYTAAIGTQRRFILCKVGFNSYLCCRLSWFIRRLWS